MRVIFAILFFISLILVLVFLAENIGSFTTIVTIHYDIIVAKTPVIEVPVWALLLVMFAAGILTTFFLEMIGYFKTRTKIVEHKKKIKKLEKEVQDRRTVYDSPPLQSIDTKDKKSK